MKESVFSSEIWLPKPPEEIFPFFGDAHNLEIITPPWLQFEVLTKGPIEMRPGTLIDYRIRLMASSCVGEQILWPGTRLIDLSTTRSGVLFSGGITSTFSNRRITEPSAETGSIMRFLAGLW